MPKILFIHFVFLCGIDLRFRICYYVTIQSYIKIDENSLGYYEQIIIKIYIYRKERLIIAGKENETIRE